MTLVAWPTNMLFIEDNWKNVISNCSFQTFFKMRREFSSSNRMPLTRISSTRSFSSFPFVEFKCSSSSLTCSIGFQQFQVQLHSSWVTPIIANAKGPKATAAAPPSVAAAAPAEVVAAAVAPPIAAVAF